MSKTSLYPRFAENHLREALEDSPVVLIHGPRQCGKTTLAQVIAAQLPYAYLNFDDQVIQNAAEADPAGFVADLPDLVILDEVQRTPSIFAAIKTAVDRNRVAGRFLLTGSTNILLLPRIADSLAGRIQIQQLHPLAQSELNRKPSRFLDALFERDFKTHQSARLGTELIERIVAGGFPAALSRPTDRRRTVWYRDYLEALVQKDVRDISRIRSLHTLPRLLTLAATQTAQLLNTTSLASSFQISRPTIQDYLTLLERMFILDTLPPWHNNRLRRLIKTPKLHLSDTGLACALQGVTVKDLQSNRTLLGNLLETFVFQELRRLASWHDADHTFSHFRTRDGVEADIVIERGSQALAAIEVKAAATVKATDFRGLRTLREAVGHRFKAGVVLYDGENYVSFGKDLFAIPIRALWETNYS